MSCYWAGRGSRRSAAGKRCHCDLDFGRVFVHRASHRIDAKTDYPANNDVAAVILSMFEEITPIPSLVAIFRASKRNCCPNFLRR
jgi:hypothetical protein